MSEPAAFTPDHLDMDDAYGARRIAFHVTPPAQPGRPSLFWLSGFTSVMTSIKVTHLAAWAREHGLGMGRFDYSGHGQSGGRAEDGTIGAWLNEAEVVFRHHTAGPQIVIGSSMGGWLALLLAARLRQTGDDAARLAGMIHIAPAWDMTQRLMWDNFPPDVREQLMRDGSWEHPAVDDDGPYLIARRLIEEGRDHLIGPGPFEPGCPLHILHGMQDHDVPWQGSLDLIAMIARPDTRLTLVKDAGHRLSRPQDLALLTALLREMAGCGAFEAGRLRLEI